MSHFTVLVIEDSKGDYEGLLDPFSEHIELEEYETDCSCIGGVAKKASEKKAHKKFGTIDEIRDKYGKENKKLLDDIEKHGGGNDMIGYKTNRGSQLGKKSDAIWANKYIKPLQDYEKELFEKHKMKDKPNPACGFYTKDFNDGNPAKIGKRFEDESGCGGTGKVMSTYNPKSQWDWYEVGGRWNGNLPNGGNESPVSELKDYSSHAVLTPDGTWHERGEMGWFGMSANDKDEDVWKKYVQKLYKEYKNCHATLVDCHI